MVTSGLLKCIWPCKWWHTSVQLLRPCSVIQNILSTSRYVYILGNETWINYIYVVTSVASQIYCRRCRLILALAGPFAELLLVTSLLSWCSAEKKISELYFSRYYQQYLKINSSSTASMLRTVPLPNHEARLLIRCTSEYCQVPVFYWR